MSEKTNYPTLVEFCFNHSLYEKVQFGGFHEGEFLAFSAKGQSAYQDWLTFQGTNDGYCVECEKATVFSVDKMLLEQSGYVNNSLHSEADRIIRSDFDYVASFSCTRNKSHKAVFYLHQRDGCIEKVGQHPSLADISIGEFAKYKKVLSKEVSGEFSKALGLAAHGVGIGAFVYLRRVLERLIKHREDLVVKSGELQASDFAGKRVVERISLLKEHLPESLVDNKQIYGVLSKGVHELREKECLGFFPVIRALMLMILEEDLEKKNKDDLKKNVEAELQKISQSVA